MPRAALRVGYLEQLMAREHPDQESDPFAPLFRNASGTTNIAA